jgi:hypothetical protein
MIAANHREESGMFTRHSLPDQPEPSLASSGDQPTPTSSGTPGGKPFLLSVLIQSYQKTRREGPSASLWLRSLTNPLHFTTVSGRLLRSLLFQEMRERERVGGLSRMSESTFFFWGEGDDPAIEAGAFVTSQEVHSPELLRLQN